MHLVMYLPENKPNQEELLKLHKELSIEISRSITDLISNPTLENIEFQLAHIMYVCARAFDHQLLPEYFVMNKDYDFGENVHYNVLRKIVPPLTSLHGKLTKEMALVLMAYVPAYKVIATDEARMYTKDIMIVCYDIIGSLGLDYETVMKKYLSKVYGCKRNDK